MQETRVRFLCLEKSPGEGNSNPLQYSYLENPMDRESWVDEVQVYSLGWREQKDRLKAGGAQLMLLVLPGVSSHPNIAQRLKCLLQCRRPELDP